jgi:hypothetical protein
LRIAKTGVHVKALDDLPELTDVDDFYLEMFKSCKDNFLSAVVYCELYGFTNDETLEAVQMMQAINHSVNKDANS